MEKEYVVDTASELGRRQLDYLEGMLDRPTTDFLDAIGIEPGQRCLDLGAGGGTITQWMHERTGPRGTVVSVDLDTDYLIERPGVEVYSHDINDGLPVDGPYDVIHARLLLLHLARREQILTMLVDALAPGGWLVLGEFSDRPRRVLAAPTDADKEFFDHVQHVAHDKMMVGAAGVSYEWAHEVPGRMAEAGLVNIHSVEHSQTMSGGTDGCMLQHTYSVQTEELLLQFGLTEHDLTRFRELMLDPRFRAWFYQFVCTRGQKPLSAA